MCALLRPIGSGQSMPAYRALFRDSGSTRIASTSKMPRYYFKLVDTAVLANTVPSGETRFRPIDQSNFTCIRKEAFVSHSNTTDAKSTTNPFERLTDRSAVVRDLG
jgi:hypothetical protein